MSAMPSLLRRLLGSRTRGADSLHTGRVSDTRAIVVGGCGRSGTTLLRVMLDSHPRICCGPESYLFTTEPVDIGRLTTRFDMPRVQIEAMYDRSTSRGEFIEVFFGEYCRLASKPRWAEKTPRNIEMLPFVWSCFPKARFLHVIRDGRDVACSLRTHPRHKLEDGKLVPLNTWKPIEDCIERWSSRVRLSRAYRSDPRYLEVRYEELVTDPRRALERVLAFVGEPWDESVLHHSELQTPSRDIEKFPQNPEATKPLTREAIGRWRRDLSADDKALFKTMAGELLVELGYESGHDW